MATIKKACKGTLYPKSSSVSRKLKSGGDLGMKSVKAGYDKNPGVTRADIIVAAKGQAKKGMKVKKAQSGKTVNPKFKMDLEKLKANKKKIFEPGTYTPPKYKNEMDSLRQTYKEKYGDGKNPKVEYYKKGGSMKKSMKTGGKMTKKCVYGCK